MRGMSTNADAAELAHFDELARHWWDPSGEMATLHVINPVRLGYIERCVGGLAGKRVVDVGCGGGILTESLARAGAQALGIDLATQALEAGRTHAAEHGVAVDYRAIAAEDLAAEQPAGFDVVCCMEMLEHVPDPAAVVRACATLCKPGGAVLFSTINRNPKSYALMIVAAEYVLNLVPRGTHEYAKFIRPSELQRWSQHAGLQPDDVTGLRYDPLLKRASLGRDLDVNYLMHCRKPVSP